jgi:Fe2+ or Zn2+ uptake regulation protein
LRAVYDTLHLFVDLGLIHRLDTGTGAVRYDTNLTLHAHIVCPSCHELREADIDRSHLRRALHEDALDRVDVVVHRRCPACGGDAPEAPARRS